MTRSDSRSIRPSASPWRHAWRQFKKDRFAMFGLALVIVLAGAAIFAPVLANDWPIAFRSNGQWYFPAIQQLADDFVPGDQHWQPPDGIKLRELRKGNGAAVAVWPPIPHGPLTPNLERVLEEPAWAVQTRATARAEKLQAYQQRLERLSETIARQHRSSGGELDAVDPTRRVRWTEYLDAWKEAVMREQSLLDRDVERTKQVVSGNHLLGTDDIGRDLLARLIYGARVSLSVGFIAMGIATLIGMIVGISSGYYGGWVDEVGSRLIELMMCFPALFLILAVIAYVEPSQYNIMAVIGLTSWTGIARYARGEFIRLRGQDLMIAARAIGASDTRIILRHLLPNSLAPVLVAVTFGIANTVLLESGLSFLGFGVQPPTPTWGGILAVAKENIETAWWLATFPGLAIFVGVTAYNLVGEGLRDALDPRLRNSEPGLEPTTT